MGIYEYVGTRKNCSECQGIFLKKDEEKIYFATIFGNETEDVCKGWAGLVRNRFLKAVFVDLCIIM